MLDEDLPAVAEGEVLEGKILPPRRLAIANRHARRAAKHASRHSAYIPLGAGVLARRWWDAHTTSRFDRFIRAAEAQGDRDSAMEWEELRQKFLVDRSRRRHDRTASVLTAVKATPYIIGGGSAALIGTGIALAIAERKFSEIGAPFKFVSEVVYWGVIAISATAVPVLIAAPCIFLSVAWHIGRKHAMGLNAGWLAAPKPEDQDSGVIVTADTIVLALQNLGKIPALAKAFREGWRPTFTTLPVRDGQGYSAVFSLPLGVTAEMIADQRPVLARNLHRQEVETWPSAGEPGYASLWIADSGTLSKAAPEYPLLNEGTVDVFTGVPGGVTARGDQVLIPLVQNNLVAGGLPGAGKSNALRVVMLGAALDPLAELNVFVFAGNGDFDSFAPRLAVYRKGIEDDTIAAAVQRLHELYDEVGRREARLAELGAKKLTRAMAEQHQDMRPIVAAFSEVHELFSHPEYGEIAAELAVKTVKRGRKTGVVLLFDTQSSRAAAIPAALVELVSVNVCFAVRNWRNNDGFLGDGAFAAGIRATELRVSRDRGTSLITGVTDAQFELIKWHFVKVDDDTGYDEATEVIERAMRQLKPGTPVEGTLPVAEIESRDLLDDLDQVAGDERVKLRDAIGLLRGLAPTWSRYRNLTATQLRADLEREGVRVVNTSGTHYLDPADLRRVLAARPE